MALFGIARLDHEKLDSLSMILGLSTESSYTMKFLNVVSTFKHRGLLSQDEIDLIYNPDFLHTLLMEYSTRKTATLERSFIFSIQLFLPRKKIESLLQSSDLINDLLLLNVECSSIFEKHNTRCKHS